MAPKFGTSGLRGLASELTDACVARYIRAFISTCDIGQALYLGGDLRASTPRILAAVQEAAHQAGVATVHCGVLPTPALALAAQEAAAGAVMVTGSHIPADRNGLKFYARSGEITKRDEEAIRAHPDTPAPPGVPAAGRDDPQAATRFAARLLSAFGETALSGRRIGIYAHSAAGRDLLADILAALGAQVVMLGRSEAFFPVDTEAVEPHIRAQIRQWVQEHQLDALVSTDGDSDRPLLADETGEVVPGDLLGQITAQYLSAETVVTPVSSNNGVAQKGFAQVIQTRIGSPFVIEAMQRAGGRVVGYEANGGFLLGFEAQGPAGPIAPLLTRDCMLPLIAPLVSAQGMTVSERLSEEPAVVTRAGRLQEIPGTLSQPFLTELSQDKAARAAFLQTLDAAETGLDLTDGLRMMLGADRVLHLRGSGNAPEMRVYVQAQDTKAAEDLLSAAMAQVARCLGRA